MFAVQLFREPFAADESKKVFPLAGPALALMTPRGTAARAAGVARIPDRAALRRCAIRATFLRRLLSRIGRGKPRAMRKMACEHN
jgi:hypothetical protein